MPLCFFVKIAGIWILHFGRLITVYCGYYLADFVVGHRLVKRETELLAVDALGDGEAQRGPPLVAFLLVRRDGIVDERLHALLLQVLLQAVAGGTKYGEDVVDARLDVFL